MADLNRPVLNSARVTLRPPVAEDAEARFVLGNSVEIQRFFGADPADVREITRQAAEHWVESLMSERYGWVIEAERRLIGSIRLHSLNPADRRANIAIGILDEAALGKGYGTEAMRLLARHAFQKLALHRLTCRVLAFNERAVAAYEKVGFVVEGRERESALIGAQWHDDLILGLLPGDLQEQSA